MQGVAINHKFSIARFALFQSYKKGIISIACTRKAMPTCTYFIRLGQNAEQNATSKGKPCIYAIKRSKLRISLSPSLTLSIILVVKSIHSNGDLPVEPITAPFIRHRDEWAIDTALQRQAHTSSLFRDCLNLLQFHHRICL